MREATVKYLLILLTIVLFVVFGGSLAWLSQQTQLSTQEGFGFFLLLSYAAGLSMIVLPCTLPLVFVIMPLAAGKGYVKGFTMALLFGLGITITLTIYGIVLGWLGKTLGLSRGAAWVLPVIGVLAYVFGLSEMGSFRLRIPSLSMPQFVQRGGDYWKSLTMGLVLGNVGVACPNPLFYVLLAYMATLANPLSSASIAFVHGLGRATPLILMAILAILGVEAGRFIATKRIAIEKWTGFGLLVFGAFAIVAWLFDLRGFWIAQTPPLLGPWAAFLALSLVPALIMWWRIRQSREVYEQHPE